MKMELNTRSALKNEIANSILPCELFHSINSVVTDGNLWEYEEQVTSLIESEHEKMIEEMTNAAEAVFNVYLEKLESKVKVAVLFVKIDEDDDCPRYAGSTLVPDSFGEEELEVILENTYSGVYLSTEDAKRLRDAEYA